MRTYDKNEPLISIHIPKTGGTSLETVLCGWFGKQFFLHYYDEKNNKPPIRRDLPPGCCIHGHFNRARGFGVTDYYPRAQQFITFLRDPFEILVSRYYDVKRREVSGEAFRNGEPLHIGEDIGAYLTAEIEKTDYHPNIMDYMPEPVNERNYREFIREHFVCIGVMEHYCKSLERLASLLRFPFQAPPHRNPAPRDRQTADLNTYRARFKETHPWPFECYEYVRSLDSL